MLHILLFQGYIYLGRSLSKFVLKTHLLLKEPLRVIALGSIKPVSPLAHSSSNSAFFLLYFLFLMMSLN